SGRIPGMTKGLSAGDQLTLAGMPFEDLHVPGHTSGAICYAGGGAAFTGDALFCGGCGRLFEGSPAQMHHSLSTVLGTLSNETVVYTGHEYTQANLEFARTLEPENQALSRRLTDVKRRRRAGE